jgi:hypothetical protein
MNAMIAGYINDRDDVFCPGCWQGRAAGGASPTRVLVTENPADPDDNDNFWIVDICAECAAQVKYKGVTLLD